MGFMPAWPKSGPQPWWVTAALSGWPEYEFGMHLVRSPHPYKVQEGMPDSGDLSLGSVGVLDGLTAAASTTLSSRATSPTTLSVIR